MNARNLFRKVAAGALALLGCIGAASAQSTSVTLVANSCYKVNDVVTVYVNKGTSPSAVIAAQFFLAFDNTKLAYLGGEAGDGMASPYNFEIVDTTPAAANSAGTIDYVVGLPLGTVNGPLGPATFARLRFTATAEICAGTALVSFRAHSPLSALVNANSQTVPATFNNLDALTIDSTPPTVTCGAGQMDIADAGTCTHTFSSIPAPMVSDNCGGMPSVSFVRSDNPTAALLDPYPVGDTTITWSATDCSGNVGTCQQHVVVSGMSIMHATVQLSNVSAGPFDRCISFQFFKTGSCPTVLGTAQTTFTFTGGIGTADVMVPCGPGFTCATARDRLHTLRRTADPGHFSMSGTDYVATFTGTDALIGGNLNDDDFIDILDYGAFVGQFGHPAYPPIDCNTAPLHADINGDGFVDAIDYTFIGGLNFGMAREPDCCGTALAVAPVMDISVWDLVSRGEYEMARTADLNHDGRLNIDDVNFLGQHGLPRCPADFNGDQQVSVQDIFAYIAAWFSSYPAADTNDDHAVNVQDIFAYLGVWFNGCN